MSSFNFGAIMVGGIVFATLGGYQLGTIGAPPFVYENASEAEQLEFLKSVSKPLEKQIRRALINPSGVGTTMSIADTELNAYSRKIHFTIRVQGGMKTDAAFDRARDVSLKKVCPNYLSGELGKNNIKIVQTFVDGKKRELEELTISNYACRKYG